MFLLNILKSSGEHVKLRKNKTTTTTATLLKRFTAVPHFLRSFLDQYRVFSTSESLWRMNHGNY